MAVFRVLLVTILLAGPPHVAAEELLDADELSGGSGSKEEEQVVESYPGSSAVSMLNKYTFDGNVIQGQGDVVESWVVFFCVDWYSPCQEFWPSFRNASEHFQDNLNANLLLASRVRFVQADCATDKPLCNEQAVNDYPTVHHYVGGQIKSTWQSLGGTKEAKRFTKWATRQLTNRTKEQQPSGLYEDTFAALEARREEYPSRVFAYFTVLMAFVIANLGYVCKTSEILKGGVNKRSAAPARGRRPMGSEHISVVEEDTTFKGHAFLPEEWSQQCTSIEL